MKQRLCIVGMGPVGLVSALGFASLGHNVIGIDHNEMRIEQLSAGIMPFTEDKAPELLKKCLNNASFNASTDLAQHCIDADIVMVAVGTPMSEDACAPNLSSLHDVISTIALSLNKRHTPVIIVIRSTIPPGSIRNQLIPLLEQTSQKSHGVDFHLASNPEFLREGHAIHDFFNTERIVIGTDNAAVARCISALYESIDAPRKYVSWESAEFAKYVDNSWHALKVTFANEMSRICDALGGNIEESSDIFLSDTQLNLSSYYLHPGFAFGGSCLPKDMRGLLSLAKAYHADVPMLKHILVSNEAHIDYALSKIMSHKPKAVALLGCAFKEGIDDLRESPALLLASKLIDNNIEIFAHDALIAQGTIINMPRNHTAITLVSAQKAVESAQVIALCHNHPAYIALLDDMNKPVIDLTTQKASTSAL